MSTLLQVHIRFSRMNQLYYYFLAAVGRKTNSIATPLVLLILRTLPLPERLLLVIDDSPTKRFGPKVEGADVHHNPTPGPADQPFLYGHVWVTISLALRHPQWGAIGLPLLAMLYVRKRTMAMIPKVRGWQRFATKLQLGARLMEWIVPILKKAGKTVWIVVDGGYTKRPFLQRVLRLRNVVRNIWTNLAVYNLNLWMHRLVEVWAWRQSGQQLVDRGDSPWDDADRRPSHASPPQSPAPADSARRIIDAYPHLVAPTKNH